MKNLRDRVERLERLLDDHLKRNPLKIDIHSLTDEERRSLIEFGALLCEIRDKTPKDQLPEVGEALLQMIRESRKTCN